MNLCVKDSASVANWSSLAGFVMEPGLLEMSTETTRLRLAIAAFYNTERLMGALTTFLSLGLDKTDLCLVGKQELFKTGSPLHKALALSDKALKTLASRSRSIGKLPSSVPLHATIGTTLKVLQTSYVQNDLSCLEKLLRDDIGAVLQDHADKGAIIVFVKASTPILQDQCVRALLRYSVDKVYSQEYPPGFSRLQR